MKKLESSQDTFRHFLSAMAFRFKHVTEDSTPDFASFEAGQGIRAPGQIILHMSGMMQSVLQHLEGTELARLEPLDWQAEKERFIRLLTAVDKAFSEGKRPTGEIELWQLWQGQLIDTMTHIGQLAMLRRLAGSTVSQGVRYWQVDMPALN